MSRPIALLSLVGCGYALYDSAYWSAAGLALIAYVASQSIQTAPPPPSHQPPKLTRSASAPERLGEEVEKGLPIGQLPTMPTPSPTPSSIRLWFQEARAPLAESSSLPLVSLDTLPRLKLNWLFSLKARSPIIDLRSSPPLQIDLSCFGTDPLSLEVGDLWGPTWELSSDLDQLFMTTVPLFAEWAAGPRWEKSRPFVFLVEEICQKFLPEGRLKKISVQVVKSSREGRVLVTSSNLETFARALQPGGELRLVKLSDDQTTEIEGMDKFFTLPPRSEEVKAFKVQQKGFWSETAVSGDYRHLIYTRAE